MNEITISSWGELQDALYTDSWNEELQRIRSRFAFRGLSDANYPLATTLMRLGGDYPQLERHLLRNFSKYAHRSVVEKDSVWDWLSVAKHYGLPTRLLDWTYSPFIAMHFATANLEHFEEDGAIWAVNYLDAHKLLPKRMQTVLEEEGANVFTVKMLSDEVVSLRELEEMAENPFVMFFEPASIDDRIVNQFSFFSVMSSSAVALDDWLQDHSQLWRKIVIPASLKWEIRDKLDQANITERVLFPGLDGLSSWLQRHYSTRE